MFYLFFLDHNQGLDIWSYITILILFILVENFMALLYWFSKRESRSYLSDRMR
ncbi:hypothetical protein HanIR_Chr09g0398931 [Helianthus annuus]|nr:hypothetical protein HanIR_Chr09g0398931 [Helianthus annuus]